MAIPVHDFTCRDDVADPLPTTACASYPNWSANGNNLYYHVPYWVGFKVDQAYAHGGDRECGDPPGQPQLDPPGHGVSCLKGWFVDKFDMPGPVSIGPIAPGSATPMTVTLVN